MFSIGLRRTLGACALHRHVARPLARPIAPVRPRPYPVSFLPTSLHLHTRSAARRTPSRRRLRNALVALLVLTVLYQTYSPFRHTVIASVRCARLMQAVILDVLDYKRVFALEAAMGDSEDEKIAKRKARQDCHTRSATRMLVALRKNSGIYVKLGQHVAAVQVLPKEWTSTMRPLQDQCFPTPIEDIDQMLRDDLGMGINDLFADFDPTPIGVASLAQVHRAVDKRTGRRVAVKLQHADLQEFVQVDMQTVNFAIKVVKYVFPDFEFDWLAQEMNEMLPLEIDFQHEAQNSLGVQRAFARLKGQTSLYIPEVVWAERRCLVMEYIEGARVDDLVYLKDHGIDRNQVSQELSRIFSQMVYLNGVFHADPHHGNLLIRTKAPTSSSPFNFDICLLDHGQYFDIPDDLRVNYARFWLSLIQRSSAKTALERRKWAKAVGNISDDMYPILESAITGQVNLGDSSALLDSGGTQIEKLRGAMMEREGLILEIFELLRVVPRRLLMILKLSDLQRSLDQSLNTTHAPSRIFIIVAQYCAKAVWQSELDSFHLQHLSLTSVASILESFLSYTYWRVTLGVVEWGMDVQARWNKIGLWVRGWQQGGLVTAGQVAAGLST